MEGKLVKIDNALMIRLFVHSRKKNEINEFYGKLTFHCTT